jgi:hypothetical protein
LEDDALRILDSKLTNNIITTGGELEMSIKTTLANPPISEWCFRKVDSAMLWKIKAAENMVSGDFVEFTNDQNGKLSCKKTLELASIRATAARDIGKGEMLIFDTNGGTKDLTTPQKAI